MPQNPQEFPQIVSSAEVPRPVSLRTPDEARTLLGRMFEAAVASASPAVCVPPALPAPGPGRTVVVGAGKASAAMARAVEAAWSGPLEGLVVTRYGHAVECSSIEIVEAAHPVPDAAGQDAAQRILALAGRLGPDDLLLCLVSGGGSALLSLPLPGLTLADKQAVNRELLACGADIHEMNAVRKHLSAIKGGRLAAAAHPARSLTLVISDVPGDDPATVASGPTVADPTSRADALTVLDRYGVGSPVVRGVLADPASETVKPGDPRLSGAALRIVATAQGALGAAAAVARAAGVTPAILGDSVEGESREVALVHAAIARQIRDHHQPFAPPCVLLSAGETTVTVRGGGRGGRNAEFLLALTAALGPDAGVYALACDTDGIDGSEDNAGCVMTPDTFSRGAALGLSARRRLDDNDGYGYFSALGDLVVTGPTLTNVNDFRALLVLG